MGDRGGGGIGELDRGRGVAPLPPTPFPIILIPFVYWADPAILMMRFVISTEKLKGNIYFTH